MTTIKDDLQCSSAESGQEERLEFWLTVVLTLSSFNVGQIKIRMPHFPLRQKEHDKWTKLVYTILKVGVEIRHTTNQYFPSMQMHKWSRVQHCGKNNRYFWVRNWQLICNVEICEISKKTKQKKTLLFCSKLKLSFLDCAQQTNQVSSVMLLKQLLTTSNVFKVNKMYTF